MHLAENILLMQPLTFGVDYQTMTLNFRHILEPHGLTEAIFADVNAHLADKGITLRSGTLVDATIIDRKPMPRWSRRSGGHLGAAERIDQTFLK